MTTTDSALNKTQRARVEALREARAALSARSVVSAASAAPTELIAVALFILNGSPADKAKS